MFIDKVKIYIKAGDGGNGCVAFHREKYISHGGPDGGDGGKGGNIIFEVDTGENTLLPFRYRRKFVASNGEDGKPNKFHGKTADDLIIKLPPGTLVKDPESGKIIFDMAQDGRFVAAKGGNGGWGNRHFATPTRQIPRFAKSGLKGEEREVLLELKMLADVGLVGFPNVGKSTILSLVSSARPKIANYHFTTLSPMLGVVSTGEEGKGFVMADIPGLIEGAAEGAGLGHEFLRHIDRCRLLVHVLDMSGSEGRDPIDDLDKINSELINYSEALIDRPQIIAANKCDIGVDEDLKKELVEYCEKMDYPVVFISAATGEGINELIHLVAEKLSELPPIKVYEPEYEPEIKSVDDKIEIRFENGVYYVESERLFNVVNSINYDDRESLSYFQKVLRNAGVIKMLEEAGAGDGDTVNIYDFEFEFVK
ncbi:MAG: GTPase ObgE [Ruminococcaceae bacterium]|nr:GTPase ObgE [Oscillospiraceae bacterium]